MKRTATRSRRTQITEEWTLPRLVPDEDCWLVESGPEELVGYAMVWIEDLPSG